MTLNMRVKMKLRCDINRPGLRDEHKYTKYKRVSQYNDGYMYQAKPEQI